MYKKLILTGCPRTGTTALAHLISSASNALLTSELGFFHPKKEVLYEKIKNINIEPRLENSKILKIKGWNKEILEKFISNESEIPKNIEFFGDKHPDYCLNSEIINHIVKNHNDAYFIFTYRDPCSTVYSFLKRSRIEKNYNATWYAEKPEVALNNIISYNLNWSTLLYPMVQNKIIVDYNKYMNRTDLLISDLERFLGTKLKINKTSEFYFHNKNYEEYKEKLNENQISNINKKFDPIKKHILCLK
jgi:hypothetical protein